jgi:hypothetical protein
MVVSVFPCVLSARAAVEPTIKQSRASPSVRKREGRVFMCTSAKG